MDSFDEILENLSRRRSELLKLLSEIEAAIEAVPRIRALAQRNLFEEAAAVIAEIGAQPLSPENDSKTTQAALSPADVVRITREILLEEKRPLKRGALVRALERRGYQLPGTDKAKNLGTILWRHISEFVNIEKLGYWPRDIKIDGVHDPDEPHDGIFRNASVFD